jgi:hypothetical protein
MKKFALGLSLLLSSGFGLVGCGDSGSSGSGGSGGLVCDGVTIPAIALTLGGENGIQESVFQGSCAFTSCHGAMGTPQAGLELSSVDVSAANLIDVDATQVDGKRVTPSDSATSYLMNKLLGEGIPEPWQMMPITGELCQAKIDAVEDWINAGAPVN